MAIPSLRQVLLASSKHAFGAADMEAFDELSPRLREAVREAVGSLSARGIRLALSLGYSEEAVIAEIETIDRFVRQGGRHDQAG